MLIHCVKSFLFFFFCDLATDVIYYVKESEEKIINGFVSVIKQTLSF